MNEQTTTNTAAHDEPLAVLPPVDDDAAGREAAGARRPPHRHAARIRGCGLRRLPRPSHGVRILRCAAAPP